MSVTPVGFSAEASYRSKPLYFSLDHPSPLPSLSLSSLAACVDVTMCCWIIFIS